MGCGEQRMKFRLLTKKELVKDQRNGAMLTHIGKLVIMENCSLLSIFLMLGYRSFPIWESLKGITNQLQPW